MSGWFEDWMTRQCPRCGASDYWLTVHFSTSSAHIPPAKEATRHTCQSCGWLEERRRERGIVMSITKGAVDQTVKSVLRST